MLPFKLSETSLRREVSDQSWSRAQSYYNTDSVMNVVCRGSHIQAQVEGTEYEPYSVSLQVDPGGFKSARCSCPYDWGGWCKHIAAVGMVCCRQPEQVRVAVPIEQLIGPLNAAKLQDLILELVDEAPELADRVEAIAHRFTPFEQQLASNQADQTVSTAPRQRQTQIDPAPYRGQAHQAILDTVQAIEYGCDDYDMEYEAFPDLVSKPEGFINAGDGASALVILDAITGTLAGEWSQVEEYGYDGDIAAKILDPLWAEALLQVELAEGEAMDWQVQLEEYAAQFNWDEFPLASEALRQGWDDPALVEILQGTADSLWEDEAPAHANEFAQIRLRILARQKRWEEYLRFAEAEEQFRDWLVALIQQGQGAAALKQLDRLETVNDAQAVAEAFRAQGNLSAAVAVVQQGMMLPARSLFGVNPSFNSLPSDPLELGPKHHELAAWGAQLAEQLEDDAGILELWMGAIAAQPKVADFNHLKLLAGEQWPALRETLLDELESSPGRSFNGEDIEIFLAEGRIQAAINRVERSYSRDMTIPVMKAAIAHDPAWVIRQGTKLANEIMDRGKADRYDQAVQYLAQVKAAYLHQDEQLAWEKYRSQIQSAHGRKRKLMGLMTAAAIG